MKQIIIVSVFLIFSRSGYTQDKSAWKQLREDKKIADTMHFPDPFEFKYVDTSSLPKNVIYHKSIQWLATSLNRMRDGLQVDDSANGKLLVSNISADDNETTFCITMDIKDGKYRIMMGNYLCHYNGLVVKIEDPSSKRFLFKVDRLLMMQKNDAIFKSLRDYINKNDDF